MSDTMQPHPLRNFRKSNPISIAALAEKAGVSAASISRIETGLQQPSPELSRALESLTGVPKWKLRPDLWDEFESGASGAQTQRIG
jgi:transcriptional regulator with XRE-family HTH domain